MDSKVMCFKTFCQDAERRRRKAVAENGKRLRKAELCYGRYQSSMRELGLPPLDWQGMIKLRQDYEDGKRELRDPTPQAILEVSYRIYLKSAGE